MANNPTDAGQTGQDGSGGGGKHVTKAERSMVEKMLDYAMQFRGTPYQWGGSSPSGFDCSGLVQFVYKHAGIDLPRISQEQARVGHAVNQKNARPGDLVYFNNADPGQPGFADHIGIYLGNGMMLAAPHTGSHVQVQPVGDASGFDRVLPDGSWKGLQRNNAGNVVYRLPNGEGVGKAAMTASGSAVTGEGGGTIPSEHVGPKDVREGLNSMGFASQLIHSNKSLQKAFESIIHDQLDLSSSAGQTRATQILQNTAWFQNHDKAQRQFEELKFSDPSQFDAMIKQERDSLKSEAEGLGLSLDPNDLDHMSRMVARNGLTSDEVNQVMARHVNLEKGQAYTGTIGSTLDALRQGAASYYVPINEQQLQHYTRQVIAGNLDPSSLNDVFKQQALSMYPYLKTQLNEGHTVADIANPYQQMISQTLELDPNGIKHNDPLVMQALQSKDAQGNMGLMPLWQFQQKLYDDPRWLNTQNAHQSLVSTTGSILQKMGLIS